jgi:hypothetical protein
LTSLRFLVSFCLVETFNFFRIDSDVALFVNLNYLFEITPENDAWLPIFDAVRLGNSTRFLNHKKEHNNVSATCAIFFSFLLTD